MSIYNSSSGRLWKLQFLSITGRPTKPWYRRASSTARMLKLPPELDFVDYQHRVKNLQGLGEGGPTRDHEFGSLDEAAEFFIKGLVEGFPDGLFRSRLVLWVVLGRDRLWLR